MIHRCTHMLKYKKKHEWTGMDRNASTQTRRYIAYTTHATDSLLSHNAHTCLTCSHDVHTCLTRVL